MGHVFISYSHSDREYALKIGQELGRRGFDFWIDRDLQPGSQWTKEVVEQLTNSSAFIVIMTPEASQSQWVEREILIAQKQSKPIFPILLAGEEFFVLGNLHYENVTGGKPPSERFFERLRKVVDGRAEYDVPQMLIWGEEGQQTVILNERHRQADLRLLYELWETVNTDAVSRVADGVLYRTLMEDIYRRTFVQYMLLREKPENHFLQPELEKAFSAFDRTVYEFDEQLVHEEKLEGIEGRRVFVPNYKLDGKKTNEVRIAQEEQFDRTIELRAKFLKQHVELVKTIKWIVPEFTFPDKIYTEH